MLSIYLHHFIEFCPNYYYPHFAAILLLLLFLKGPVYFIYLFILAAPGPSCGTWTFQLQHAGFLASARMWVLALRPGIEPGPPALGAWSLTHCHQGSPAAILLTVLLNPSLHCSLQDRPIHQEMSCWGKE